MLLAAELDDVILAKSEIIARDEGVAGAILEYSELAFVCDLGDRFCIAPSEEMLLFILFIEAGCKSSKGDRTFMSLVEPVGDWIGKAVPKSNTELDTACFSPFVKNVGVGGIRTAPLSEVGGLNLSSMWDAKDEVLIWLLLR